MYFCRSDVQPPVWSVRRLTKAMKKGGPKKIEFWNENGKYLAMSLAEKLIIESPEAGNRAYGPGAYMRSSRLTVCT